jgi:hypothetical protein
MKRIASLILAIMAAACTQADASSSPSRVAIAADALHPIVLELFQSQGCSSCPPANANLNALADRPEILALSFPVTYWDHLGWKDRFARPEFTQRQQAYAASGRSDGVYTPQFVINGRSALVGGDRNVLNRAISAAGPAQGAPAIEINGNAIALPAGNRGSSAQILLVTYDARVRSVPIRAGENNGRTLPHRNIVTGIRNLGSWNGAALRIALPPRGDTALMRAVLLQQGEGGPILAARKI